MCLSGVIAETPTVSILISGYLARYLFCLSHCSPHSMVGGNPVQPRPKPGHTRTSASEWWTQHGRYGPALQVESRLTFIFIFSHLLLTGGRGEEDNEDLLYLPSSNFTNHIGDLIPLHWRGRALRLVLLCHLLSPLSLLDIFSLLENIKFSN